MIDDLRSPDTFDTRPLAWASGRVLMLHPAYMSTLILILPIHLPLLFLYNSTERERAFYFSCRTFSLCREVVQAAFLEVGVLGCNITDPVKVNNCDNFTTLFCNIANDIDVLTQIPNEIRLEL